jgi:hypothetical protein
MQQIQLQTAPLALLIKINQKVSISTLNVKNIKSNFLYSKFLTDMSNIVFFNELWLKPNEINHLKDLTLEKRKKFLFQSDMTYLNKKGRPFGGIGLVFDNAYEVIEYKFLNRHLAFFHLKQKNFELAILGTYMPFDDSKKRDQSKSIYELTLSYIHVLINKFKNMSIPVIILGDFNGDLNRRSNNRFDSILKNFVQDNDLIVLDEVFPQVNNFTFSPNGYSSETMSKIDHIMIPNTMYEKFSNLKCEILRDVTNTSDHNAINLQFEHKINEFSLNNININTNEHHNISPDFDDPLVNQQFNKFIDEEFVNFDARLANFSKNNAANDQNLTDEFYLGLCNVFENANNRTLNYFKKIEPKFRSHHGKKGFGAECIRIKSELILAQKELEKDPFNSDKRNLLKILQTKYRSAQRKSLYLDEAKEVNILEKVSHEHNKTKFWIHVKRSRNKRSIQKSVTISNKDLVDHYKNFFKESNVLTPEQKEISQKVKNLSESYSIPTNLKVFELYQIEIILDEVKSSKVKGHDKLFYDLLKNTTTIKFKYYLLAFFNQLLSTNTIPTDFNISIIKPILKDTEKSSNDTNNIRPISISNCFAQFLEKLILISSPKLRIIHKNQFGFKQKTSCNHAIFAVKETILHYTENGSGVLAASLDAEKAFDKVWRDGLFYKLIDQIEPPIWNLLKKYYESSRGVILDDITNLYSSPFKIESGVKQGGYLSSYLYNIYINQLIESIINLEIGAHIGKINTSIIVYADDILIISPRTKHLQTILNICAEYGQKWLIKFNASKSNIIEFGNQIISNNVLKMNDNIIPLVDEIVYLGVTLNKSLNFDAISREKFKNVQRSIFSLSFLGLKPRAISPFLQAFIYKTYCLSLYTYSLETTTLTKETKNFLNTAQNNLIRQMIGLSFSCHISKILNCLKIHTFHDLYIKTKLSFIRTLCFNEISNDIFIYLSKTKDASNRSKSFKKDIAMLEEFYKKDISVIHKDAKKLEMEFLKKFQTNDGISDSIRLCLINYREEIYREMLDNIIKPEYIRDDEEFQDLLQYLIIIDDYH